MLAGLRLGVPGLPCLYAEPCGDGVTVFDTTGVGTLFKFSILTSVPSSFFSVTFVRGTKALEPALRRLVGIVLEAGVGGGDVNPLGAWEIAGGGCGAWTGLGKAWDKVGVPGPWRAEGGFRGDIGMPGCGGI